MRAIDAERSAWFATHRTCGTCGSARSGAVVETMRTGERRPALECLSCGRVKAYIPRRLMRLSLDEIPPKGAHPEGYGDSGPQVGMFGVKS